MTDRFRCLGCHNIVEHAAGEPIPHHYRDPENAGAGVCRYSGLTDGVDQPPPPRPRLRLVQTSVDPTR